MSKIKIASYLLLIFIAGGVAGGAIAFSQAQRAEAGSPRPERHGRGAFEEHVVNQFRERLKLTPEQESVVLPILRRGFQEIKAIQDRTLKEVGAIIKKTDAEIARQLTPEQQKELEKMAAERDENFRRRHDHMRDKSTTEVAVPLKP